MQDANGYDVIIVGHFAKDRNVYQGEARTVLGGAVQYGGAALASTGVRGAILTRLSEQDRPLLDGLEARGVQVFCRYGSSTTGIQNTYLDENRDRRTCRPLAVGEPFEPGEFAALSARIVHVAPLIQGEAPEAFVRELATWGALSLDAQGFLRVHRDGGLRLEANAAFSELARSAAFLKLDHAEAEVMTGERDLTSALSRLEEAGVREVVLTHAEGVIASRDGHRVDAPWTARRLDGRTGRGDTCMAAYLACRSLDLPPEDALPVAACLTSRKMEREGPLEGDLAELAPLSLSRLVEKIRARTGGSRHPV